MNLAKYLGKKSSDLLEDEPFKNWNVEKSKDDDSNPPLIRYIFKECGIELSCDQADEKIRSLFINKDNFDGEVLSEIPFTLKRENILTILGVPSKSGEAFSHPALGEFGAWDSFGDNEFTTHVQYKVNSNSIERITLMRNDVVPNSP